MTSRLNPYLSFPAGTAREAGEFYQSVFGGELTVMTFGQFGPPPGMDPDWVMHSQLESPDGFTLMVSDSPPTMERTVGNSVTVSVSGDDAETLRGYWTALSEGAEVHAPLEKQMWGDEFGSLTDKYGVPWMFDIAGS
jgi:PhnB protein